MTSTNSPVKKRLLGLLDDLIHHDGYGSLKVEIRLLRRGQKEIIIDAGKQYRYIVDFKPQMMAGENDGIAFNHEQIPHAEIKSTTDIK